MLGIQLEGRIKKATSSFVFAEDATNEHEAFVVWVLLELHNEELGWLADLQQAKVGALVLQDILGEALPQCLHEVRQCMVILLQPHFASH